MAVRNELSVDDVRHIASLCRIGMNEDEIEEMRLELANLLDDVAFLQSIDTDSVEPTGHAVDAVHSVMRDDEPRPPLPIDAVLANAPQREGDYFRVRRVLE